MDQSLQLFFLFFLGYISNCIINKMKDNNSYNVRRINESNLDNKSNIIFRILTLIFMLGLAVWFSKWIVKKRNRSIKQVGGGGGKDDTELSTDNGVKIRRLLKESNQAVGGKPWSQVVQATPTYPQTSTEPVVVAEGLSKLPLILNIFCGIWFGVTMMFGSDLIWKLMGYKALDKDGKETDNYTEVRGFKPFIVMLPAFFIILYLRQNYLLIK